MQKKYIVRLSKQERNTLREVIKKLKGGSEKVRHAQILLKLDVDSAAWSDSRIAAAFSCRRQTVELIRQRFVECGFQVTLDRKKLPNPPTEKFARWGAGGEDHHHPPWTAAERLRELDTPPARSQACRAGNRGCGQLLDVSSHVKKSGMTNRKMEYWGIPPNADGEFVANMEEVLETSKPYDPTRPVLCVDDQPVPLIKETRTPIEATAKHPRRIDYEYERAAPAEIFMFTEPLSGWRMATARESKTKVDRALTMAKLLDGRYRECDKVILVCDNLNTHTKGAFYEAFPPAQARQNSVTRQSMEAG